MKQETTHDGWDPYAFNTYLDYVEEAVMQNQVVMQHNEWVNNMLTKKAYEHAVRRKQRLMDKTLNGDFENPSTSPYTSNFTFSTDEF